MKNAEWWKSLEGPKEHGLSTKLQLTVCAWCGATIGHRWTFAGGESHGICEECKEKVLREY